MEYVQYNLQWLRYIHATMVDHKFMPKWERKVEKFMILVRLIQANESPHVTTLEKNISDEFYIITEQ